MKAKVFSLIFTVILLSQLMVAQPSVGEDVSIPPNPIKIDEHWIDVFQDDDAKNLEIVEYMFINNTGDVPFNDDIYIWLQKNSNIKAECCGDAPNMGCRLKEGGGVSCFNVQKTQDNIFYGAPFSDQEKLSYYGQKAWLRINADSIANLLINNTLHLNVSLGGISVPRGSDGSQGGDLQITSDNIDIGIHPVIDMYMPRNITVTENIRVVNNGTESEVINLSIEGILQDWTAELMNASGRVDAISLLPQEHANLTLRITAPSYIASLKLSYSTKMNIEGQGQVKGSFSKQYLYDSKRIEYFIYLLSDKGLELSEDLTAVHPSGDGEPNLNEDFGRYWYVVQSQDIEANSRSTITVGWEEPADPLAFFTILAVILIIALLVAVPILKKKGLIGGKEDVEGGDSVGDFHESSEKPIMDVGEGKTRKLVRLEKEKKLLLLALRRVKSDENDGNLDPDEAKDIKKHYLVSLRENKIQIDELNKGGLDDQSSSEGNEKISKPGRANDVEKLRLQKRINNINIILLKLEDDHDNGHLPGEVYSDLKEKYEKEVSETQKILTEEEKTQAVKKETMLKAIARLDEERDLGQLDDETYNMLRTDYERALESFDEQTQRQSTSPKEDEQAVQDA